MMHKLKCHSEYFHKVKGGLKNFEIRKDDRNYCEGDELLLEEFVPEKDRMGNEGYYTGHICHRRVDYILRGGKFGLEEGYVILSLSKV